MTGYAMVRREPSCIVFGQGLADWAMVENRQVIEWYMVAQKSKPFSFQLYSGSETIDFPANG
jgi:hypothetical protein